MYNVIVADDEKNIREGIVELIEWEKLGCKVCASMQNGAQVLKYLEEEKIHVDIIITDIKMPIMDGMELIGMLNERFPDIKVIILTAYSDFTYAQQAIKFQVSDFVVKNDFFLELPRAVKKIIEQCEVDAKKCVGREKEIPFFQGEACRVCACEMRDSLKDIGKELCVNSSYLSRVYKKETGYTVTDAINSYRIEKAKEILETGEYRVCEVGEMVGIEDPAYFTHVFLKYEGKSPSDFMNR